MVWELLTNPVLVAVAVLLALSALRMNVVFALVVASVVGGLMGAVDGGEAWAMLGHGEFHAFWNCCVGGFSGTMKAFLSNLDNGAVLAIERKNKILGRLREEKSVLVGELAKEFGVSEETIRRDLDKLEKESGVIKTYGGALLRDGTERELPYVERRKINVEAKKAIAALAARLVQDGDSLILDASSTAVFIARALKSKKNITLEFSAAVRVG